MWQSFSYALRRKAELLKVPQIWLQIPRKISWMSTLIFKKALLAKIQNDVGEQFEFSQDMDQLFNVDKVFEGLNTDHKQRCYYKENFNLMVSKEN